MDLKNLCHNIDVNNLRSRIPSLPAMPAMPQIKLPKSLPKLRPHRIFSRSREDLNRSKGSVKEQQQQQQTQLQPPIAPADFINHSPHRISTISSLMHEQQQSGDSQRGTYRSACSVDDDYPSPRQFQVPGKISRPISDVHTPINGLSDERAAEEAAAKLSLTEKLQKGYKDITEFRLSHIFAKKTVVRQDTIQVDHYVERFNADREREQAEQERRDRKIANNYHINFKASRQDINNSKCSISSDESPKQEVKPGKSVHEHSGDESGMEATPPLRNPNIASTRFTRECNPVDESNNELNEDEEVPAPRIAKITQSSPEASPKEAQSRGAKALHKLRGLGKRVEETPVKLGEKKRRAPLTPQQSEENPEPPTATGSDNTFSVLKQNIKRFSKSVRRTQGDEATWKSNGSGDTQGDCTAREEKQVSRTDKMSARLRKFGSHEASNENLYETSPKETEGRSPIRAVIKNKLQTWKKSFKGSRSEPEVQTGDDSSPEIDRVKGKRSDNLVKKLRNIRSQTRANSTDDLDGTENKTINTPTGRSKDDNSRRTSNLEERFEEARKRTLKKVNEKMQQIKLFQRPQDNIDKDNGPSVNRHANKHTEEVAEDQSAEEETIYVNPRTTAKRNEACVKQSDYKPDHLEAEYKDDIKNSQQEYDDNQQMQHTRAHWTTKNLLTGSLDSETDIEIPRVLLHQDNSDQFESTITIAVTRPAPVIPTTPVIEEIHDDRHHKGAKVSRSPSPGRSRAEWIPNTDIISSFLEITPPNKRRLSSNAIMPAPRGHARKMSMDSNSDSDSWIPENSRNRQLGQESIEGLQEDTIPVTLKRIDENEEPWKVYHTHSEEKLYKTKSIDIFEASIRKGGPDAAFDDFEEELRNEPILRVSQRHIDSSFEKESSEEPFAVDDDNSSRVTKISVSVIREECEEIHENIRQLDAIKVPEMLRHRFGNSKESLITKFEEGECKHLNAVENGEQNGDYDQPPSGPPSPPPSISPPPPPLPLRKPAVSITKSLEESAPPSLPPTKPSIAPTKLVPPRIPERTPSMTRIAKPLVKTSSLRLAYNEQVKPADVGKVNKLITRFETTQPNVGERPLILRRRLLRDESEEYSDDEDDLEDDYDEQDADVFNSNERDSTPTPTNMSRTYSLESDSESLREISAQMVANKSKISQSERRIITTNRSTAINAESCSQTKTGSEVPKIALNFDTNSNMTLSRASSEYGSPQEYPSSLIGSTQTTPTQERRPKEQLNAKTSERNRRSMTRDDDKFVSFDSDEENSYYSISSSGSNRNVVEI